MTDRQVRLITELVAACWERDEKRGAIILVELLGDRINPDVLAKAKQLTQPN